MSTREALTTTAAMERALDRAVCRRITTDPAYICATTDEDRRAREDEIEREECGRLAQPGGMFR